MPSKIQRLQEQLAQTTEWVDFIKAHSNLPGPRGNLELAEAVANQGDVAIFITLLAQDGPQVQENTPEVFVVFCGLVGLGKLMGAGDLTWVETLRRYANDLRWRLREAVAIAFQKMGLANIPAVLSSLQTWSGGTRLEQRAVVAALCEPVLLRDAAVVKAVLVELDVITASLVSAPDRSTDNFHSLRQTLGYGWSVAAAACFTCARPYLDKWCAHTDQDVRWVMRENLGKKRLIKAAPAWVEDQLPYFLKI